MEGMRFVGKFYSYRELMKSAERKLGNVALCYTKKHKGYSTYLYGTRSWTLLASATEKIKSLASEGKCFVVDKQRVPGLDYVIVVDDLPSGLRLNSKIRSTDGFPFVVKGFGHISHHDYWELILAPNASVNEKIKIGDMLCLINEGQE